MEGKICTEHETSSSQRQKKMSERGILEFVRTKKK